MKLVPVEVGKSIKSAVFTHKANKNLHQTVKSVIEVNRIFNGKE